ncbi:MAG: N-acetyl-gamma-glutamyl-phosphate reductase [Flavobacteriaceae bacterium]|jgi:N-acetyl-gamma-glutamyl-phosphate reductase|tara:strand:- start:7516 stop:8487 length:972 start_codon:yes stop_codon:yes gene_type:complete
MKNVGIIGGSGYTGGELIRLVLQHPALELYFVYSTTRVGKPLSSAHPDLLGSVTLDFTANVAPDIDILYLCLGHGNSNAFLKEHSFSDKTIIIDLGNDFRLEADQAFQGRNFVYGLPELQKEKIEKAKSIANPGCFATAIQLALLPLAHHNLINSPVHINATTGSTGAGVGLSDTSHFSWRNNNLSWYKPFTHQHLGEIHQGLEQLDSPSELYFMPQRGDFTRGIFATLYTSFEGSLEEAKKHYHTFYESHPFTQISEEKISLKSVINTNYCFIHLHKHGNTLLITSVIDNLVKGASGQAIQNTNLIMGWEENLGLQLKASIF